MQGLHSKDWCRGLSPIQGLQYQMDFFTVFIPLLSHCQSWFLSVVQRFNGNRRGQPYPAELLALHLYLKQHTVVKEFAVQRVKGHHPGYQKSWVCFLWYRRNLTVLHLLLYQRTADLPYFRWVQSHTRWALSKNTYQSKPFLGDGERNF